MPNRTPASSEGGEGDGGGDNGTTFEHAVGPPLHGPIDVRPTNGTNVTSLVINATVTTQPSTEEDGGSAVPGGVIALLLCLLLVGVAVLCLIFYLKRTGKLYKMIPFKPLINTRRSSLSHSDRASLHVDGQDVSEADHNAMGDLAHNRDREAAAFTIEDHDMDSVDIDSTSRGTNDEYFYDEVFGKSMFEDETTNASMRELYLASDEAEDELDVDALVDSITGDKAKAAKT